MKIKYDPIVDALDIRILEGNYECEVIHISDQVNIDVGPRGKIVAVEILDVSKMIPDLKTEGIEIENLLMKNHAAA